MLVVHKQNVIAKVGSKPNEEELITLLSNLHGIQPPNDTIPDFGDDNSVDYPGDIMPDLKKFAMQPHGYEDFGNKFPFIDNETEMIDDSTTIQSQVSLLDAQKLPLRPDDSSLIGMDAGRLHQSLNITIANESWETALGMCLELL